MKIICKWWDVGFSIAMFDHQRLTDQMLQHHGGFSLSYFMMSAEVTEVTMVSETRDSGPKPPHDGKSMLSVSVVKSILNGHILQI